MSTNVKIVISAQDKASNVIANITRQLQQLEMTASQMKTIQIRASGAVSQAVKATSVRIPTSGYKYYTKNVTNSNLADDFYKKAQTPVQNVALGTREIAHNIRKASGSSNILSKRFLSIGGALMLANRAGRLLGNALEESGKWIENINLFKVTFGEASDEAYDFAMTLSKAFGISANEVIRYTGLFKQMTEAIGVAEQTSTDMAKTLTALGYDIAAFYNITTEQAMEKLRAGIAGQTKPLRQLGMDITAQSLDKYMSDKMGLSYTSKQLSQSDKVILRTIIMLEQAKNAYGDMAKTVNSYANQIKVLQGSVDNLKLALGDLFVSDATNIIAKINGLIIAFTNIIRLFVPLKKGDIGLVKEIEYTAEEIEKLKNKYPDFKKWIELPENAGKSFADWLDQVKNLDKAINRLSFDKFESLSKSNGNGLLGLTGLFEDELFTKQEEFFEEYNKRMDEIANKANEVAEKILKSFGLIEENGIWKRGDDISLLADAIGVLATSVATYGAMLVGIKFANFIQGAGAAVMSLKLLDIASKALVSGGLALIIYSVIQLVTNFDNLSKKQKTFYFVLIAVGVAATALGIVLMVLQAKYVGIMTSAAQAGASNITLAIGLNTVNASAKKLLITTSLLVAGIVALGIGVYSIVTNWDNMGSWQKVITIFGALAAAAIAAAVAIGVFHASWTMGVGAAAIAAGIALVVGSVISANKVTKFADGGVPDRGSLFVAGESGAELVYNMGGGSTGVSNVAQLQDATAGALRQVIVPILRDILDNMNIRSSGNGDVYMDTRKVTDEVYKHGNRVGYWK